jgi:hypothetical protein
MRTPPEITEGEAREAVLTSPQEHRECLQAVLTSPQEYRDYLQAKHAQALSTIGIVMLACALAIFLGKDWRKERNETKT